MDKKQSLTEGAIGKLIFKLSLPMIIAQVINLLYNMVDRIYIGNYNGEEGLIAIGGVGACFPIIIIISAFAALFGMGGSPLAAIALGNKDQEKAEKMKHKGHSELVYTNGDIITIDNGKIGMISENPKEFDIQKIKNDLIEGILKANQYLVGDKNLNISGTYYPGGQASEPKRISFSKRELEETTKSGLVLRNIDQPKLKELLDKRIIQRHNLIKALNNNSIDKFKIIRLL